VTIREFQTLIERIYLAKDSNRGIPANVAWLAEEVGELARALRKGEREEAAGEFADVLAWLCTLASIAGVDLEEVAASKYRAGCPKCGQVPCRCADEP
jgi:NTP pyrophosphatase (non-canonical NTP hydrolase)